MKRAPCVDLKTDVFKDERFEALADIAGYNRYEAIGRMSALYAWCIDRGLKDAPDDCDGYAVSEAVLRRFVGPLALKAILADDCDELALGVRRDDGFIYLRGTSEYVSERRKRAATAAAGGNARSDGPRDESGKFVPPTTVSQLPAGFQPAASQPHPASSSSSSPSGRERTDPPSLPARDRGLLAESVYARLSALRTAIATELGVAAIPLPAYSPAEPRGFRDLRERIREEGTEAPRVCDHVLAMLEEQARDERSIEWLDEKAFTPGGWRTARNRVAGQSLARAGPKRGAFGSAPPRNDHPESDRLLTLQEAMDQCK